MGYKVVVAGATGNVGREMLNILAEREFPVDEIAALASRKSLGTEVSFGDKTVKTQGPRHLRLHRLGHRPVRRRLRGDQDVRPQGRRGGLHRDRQLVALPLRPDVPLIVPEVNADAIMGYAKAKNIIANPNCSTAQMVVALKPLHDRARIKRVVVVDLPVGVRRRQGRHGRAVGPDQGHLRPRPGGAAARSSPSRSPST